MYAYRACAHILGFKCTISAVLAEEISVNISTGENEKHESYKTNNTFHRNEE